MRQVAIAVVLSLPLFSGCATCCDFCFDMVGEMLFPGSSLTLDQEREIDTQHANFARRDEIEQAQKDRPSQLWQPH